jgi:hypothetical protein
MLPLALLVVGAFATEDAPKWHCWPANPSAPYCGCQWITDEYNMVNETCTLQFPDYSKNSVHMLSVASSYPLQGASDSMDGKFVWTGFEGLSHFNLHDILVFFDGDICMNGDLYNITMADADFKPTLSCVDYGGPWEGPLLGNFNYDIARSVQQYNLPIYGLDQGEFVAITINDMDGEGLRIQNVSAHHGHGHANADDCESDGDLTGYFTYLQEQSHMGQLEYAQFNLCDPHGYEDENCWKGPQQDYCFKVPSAWDSTIEVIPQ